MAAICLHRIKLCKPTTCVIKTLRTSYVRLQCLPSEPHLLTANGHVQHMPHCCVYRPSNYSFFVPDKKMGRRVKEELPKIEEFREGLKIIQEGIPKFKQEMIDKLKCDIKYHAEHFDFEYLTEFKGEESLKNWIVTSDNDLHSGKSKVNLAVSSSNKALFYGYLNTDKPKDGVSRKGGFCNLRSPYNTKSFERMIPYDWLRYSHMFLRVRGDGRNYMLNIQMDRFFDMNWHDMYHYPLYTRGGPYWQLVKVPFSKFFFANSGRIQDRQEKLDLTKVSNFSISVIDNIAGKFQLEIDYIALVRDESYDEDFAYELYQKSAYEI